MTELSGSDITLGYCTNVHAGRDLAETLENLDRYAVGVRRIVSPEGMQPLGLWLSNQTAAELVEQCRVPELQAYLAERGLSVFTINGFPYGDFHQAIVKHKVYEPTWQDPARMRYTINLARILTELIPENAEGSISTLPIAWGKQHDHDQTVVEHLLAIVQRFAEIEEQTGRLIHLDIEPEPGCLIDVADDVIRLFGRLAEHCLDAALLRRHLRVCHDVCHAAVMFEDQRKVLDQYAMAGIEVGKVQISSAVEVDFQQLTDEQKVQAMGALKRYCEPKYLHQTVVRRGNRTVFYEDLPDAIENALPSGQWRTHFHVPIYLEDIGLLQTTQQDIIDCLSHLRATSDVKHYEVETYAWNVLPDDIAVEDLAEGIAKELKWVKGVVH